MKRTTFLTAALLMGGTGALAFASASLGGVEPASSQESAQEVAPAKDVVATLAAEYDEAVKAHKKELKEAKRTERKAIRDRHPVNEYWPKFQKLAEGNNGRALMWLADHVKDNRSIKRADRAKTLKPIYAALIKHHGDKAWFGDALNSLSKNAKMLEEADVAQFYKDAATGTKGDAKGLALFYGAKALMKDDPKTANGFLDTLLKEHKNDHVYTKAQAMRVKSSDVVVGKAAPDFLGETKDGFKFHLEDYKGKVTVLDFYGFW